MRLWRVAVACSALVLACAPASLAHGIHKSGLPADTPLPEFFRLGVVHMLGGYDHLLFVLGIAILFTRTADVIKAVTLFTLGHSTTLIVATAIGLKLNPLVVDAVIGLSVAYIGLEIAVAQHDGASMVRTRIAVLVFGLIHGLGLSTRLQDLGLPKANLFERVLSFNVGVEIGQLAALTCLSASSGSFGAGVGSSGSSRLPVPRCSGEARRSASTSSCSRCPGRRFKVRRARVRAPDHSPGPG